MELQLNKVSFIDEFTKVRSIENRKAKDRSEGFKYIHEATTKRLALGDGFDMSDIDFTKFTNDDLVDYMDYYHTTLEPKITMVKELFDLLNRAKTVFAKQKQFF